MGLWAREAVYRWAKTYDSKQLLIGEVPLIGNRLTELIQPYPDAAEAVLNDPNSLFVIPTPSRAVRQVIEAARAQTIANPRHEKETKDAQPSVLQSLWRQVAEAGAQLGFTDEAVAYDPEIYTTVYQHLLAHRHHLVLPINTILNPNGSAYALQINGTELAATPVEVRETLQKVEQLYSSS